jgi:hypothetical protein
MGESCDKLDVSPAVGGHRGFSKVIWTVKEYVAGGNSPYITLYYRSFDGEQGVKIQCCAVILFEGF